MALEVRSLTGADLVAALPALARLRMIVFRDWPYLYDGSLAYEEEYLAKFAAAKGAVCIAAYDGEEIVGASTGQPMAETDAEFIEPFEKAGYEIARVFYCEESVLLASHRGHGLGHAFFDGREAHARRLGGFTYSTFCRVVRPDDHPLKPKDYRPSTASGASGLCAGRGARRHLRVEGCRPARADIENDAVLVADALAASSAGRRGADGSLTVGAFGLLRTSRAHRCGAADGRALRCGPELVHRADAWRDQLCSRGPR